MRNLGPAPATLALGWAAVAVLAMLVWALPYLPEPLWPVPLALAAVPLAVHLGEWRLLKRRAFLGRVTAEGGIARALFWRGRLVQIGAGLAAIAVIAIVYVSASFFHWLHWLALAIYVPVLAAATGPLRNALKPEISGPQLGMVLRHGPLAWAGAAVLGAVFLALGFLLDQPDVRGGSFAAVLELAYHEGAEGPRAASLAMLLGAANAVRMGFWHWAQIAGPQFGTGAVLFWLVVLLAVGGIASLLNAYVLSTVGLAESIQGAEPALQTHPFKIAFLGAIVASAGMVYALASHGPPVASLNLSNLQKSGLVAYLDRCSSDKLARQQAVFGSYLAVAAMEEKSRTQAEIEAAVEAGFQRFEPAVEAYLDWYFSLAGEYGRLVHAFAAEAFIAGKFDEIVLAAGEGWLTGELGAIEARSGARLQQTASGHAERLRATYEADGCLTGTLAGLDFELTGPGLQHVYGTAAGSAAGLTAGVLIGTRLGSRIAARVGTKGLFKTTMAALGRAGVKRGTSGAGAALAGTAICSPSGPGAIVCGTVAGLATWLAVDVVVLSIDEYYSRDAMRADIAGALDATRRELIESLTRANAARVAAASTELSALQDQEFSVIREGLNRPRR